MAIHIYDINICLGFVNTSPLKIKRQERSENYRTVILFVYFPTCIIKQVYILRFGVFSEEQLGCPFFWDSGAVSIGGHLPIAVVSSQKNRNFGFSEAYIAIQPLSFCITFLFR